MSNEEKSWDPDDLYWMYLEEHEGFTKGYKKMDKVEWLRKYHPYELAEYIPYLYELDAQALKREEKERKQKRLDEDILKILEKEDV